MKISIVLFILLFCKTNFAQIKLKSSPIEVRYNLVLNDKTDSDSFVYALQYKLVSDANKSYQNLERYLDTTLFTKDGQSVSFTSEKNINKPNYFKDLNNNQVIYGASNSFKKSVKITDDVKFEYKPGKLTKKILGYDCKQLFVSFRGRDYEIFYAPDIAITDGPWKFQGAPGLILEVTDYSNSVLMKATQIEFKNQVTIIDEPQGWNKREEMNYGEFVKSRSEWREKVIAKLEAEDPMTSIQIPYRNFEIYHPYFIDNHR